MNRPSSRGTLAWAIGVFVVLAVGLHWGMSMLIPAALRPTLISLGMITPAIAAALVYTLLERRPLFSEDVRNRIWGTRPAVILGSAALVLALQGIVFTIIVLAIPHVLTIEAVRQEHDRGALHWLPLPASIAVGLLVAVVLNVIPALGEEIGWRGFLYPRLETLMGYGPAVIVGGIVWSFWHSPPFYFINDFNGYGLSWWAGCAYFCLFTIPGGIVFYWLYQRSGSILAPAIAHATADVSGNLMAAFLNSEKLSPLVTNPAAAVGMIVWWLMALLLLWDEYRRRTATSS